MGFVHTLRDSVLSGDFDAAATSKLAELPRGVTLVCDGLLRVASDDGNVAAEVAPAPAPPPTGGCCLVS